ncbi:helix-turn-helix domain-containing protein [Flavobacterium microcysteis]|uniref:Helix-turn-helix domain-containing protein n=1 Tax=Flavobacterium microcysteis TaxID=2596891 RepID=A0A501Q4B6_9FLAO|nr:AraC family transcriptional regulator [Flavobacterium microcysteis]TPD67057.1 helix-turn-helix domain-containing protein [Flavobacterium microcysteis]
MILPIFNIEKFRAGQLAGKEELLFNELHGERHIEEPHKHDFFSIVLFEKGEGKHTIDSIEYEIENSQVHLLFPGQLHKWDIKSGTIGYQLMAERTFFEQFAPYFRFSITEYQNHPVFRLADATFNSLLYEFKAVKEELQKTDAQNHIIYLRAAIIASIVSSEAEQLLSTLKAYESNPRLAKFNTLVDQFFKEQKQVTFYANELHVSANYLNTLCRKHLKTSATQLIQQRISTESKRLLSNTNLSIKEIAFELGFADHAYFSNFFKSQTGMTPSAFREKR